MMIRNAALLSLVALLAAGCNNDGDGNANPVGGGGGGGGGGGAPTLTAADQNGTSPCPNQAILTDAGMFATFQAALVGGTFLYLDVPFNGADANIYKKKCGLDSFWNPSDNTDEIAPFSTPVTVSSLFQTGNAGICASGFNNGSFGTGEGFPVAGVYRKEFKVTHMAMTYLVRTRVTVTGVAAGDTFASRSITVPGDLETTLGYEVDGTAEVHANVLTAIAMAMASPDATVMLDILDAPGGNLLLSALVEIICVEIV